MYADDVILLSISVSDLQLMFNVCADTLKQLDLPINVTKSHCLRIVPRFNSLCRDLVLNNTVVKWQSNIKFLGITICQGKQFNCCWKEAKSNFYCSANTILGRLGTSAPVGVLSPLINAQSLPNLLYGTVATGLTKADLCINFAYNSVFAQNFKSNDARTILNCQYYCGVFTFTMNYEYQRYLFLNNLILENKLVKHYVIDELEMRDYLRIQNKYKFSSSDSKNMIRLKVWKLFSSQID